MPEPNEGARHEDPSAAPTLWIAIIGAALLFVTVVALQALYVTAQDAERARKNAGTWPAEIATLRAGQQGRLSEYRWVDEARGVIAIPIDRAMEIVVRERGAAAPGRVP